MKSEKWDYGGAWKSYDMNGPIILPNESVVQVCDWTSLLPYFMLHADTLFIDPPWNTGNYKSFYTKAEIDHKSLDFMEYTQILWSRILQIQPKTLFIEMGKQHLSEYLTWCKKHFKSVTFYNSTYYHKKNNKCYIIHATQGRPKRYKELEDLDEEDAIKWVCANHEYEVIGDLCMGRGLVGKHAFLGGKRFVGTELNAKRLAVLVDFIRKNGG